MKTFFRAYTRKSSAVAGMERAGINPGLLAQHEGQWGFFLNEDADPKLLKGAAFVCEETVDLPEEAVAEAEVLFKPVRNSESKQRRKALRLCYQTLGMLRKAKRNDTRRVAQLVSGIRREVSALQISNRRGLYA